MDTLFDMPEFRKLIEYTVSASIIGGTGIFAKSYF